MKSLLPLRYSVPLLMLVAGLLIVGSAWFLESRELQRNALRLGEERLRSIANFTAAEMEAALRDRDSSGVRAAIERAASSAGIDEILLVGPDGTVRYAADAQVVGKRFEEVGAAGRLSAILPAASRPSEILIRPFENRSRLAGRFPLLMRMSADELLPNRVGSLFITIDLSRELAQGRRRLALRMLGWIGMLSVIALGFWLLLRSLLLKRIEELIHTVREVGKGNFEQKPAIEGKDELAQLGREVETMTSRLREHSERLAYLADHDALTGLMNRHGFEEELQRALLALRRRRATRFVLALLDIDSLRVVNDTQSHLAGDELLRVVADLIVQAMPESVCTARVGGDEFAILLEVGDEVVLESLAERLQTEATNVRFEYGGERFGIQLSLGLVELSGDLRSASDALGIADAACYRAKEKGRGSYYVGSVDRFSSEKVRGDMQWVSRIQSAIDEGRLRLYAQSIIPTAGARKRRGIHFEVLVRMLDEQGQLLPPGDFLQAAERYNLVHRIDRWVVGNCLNWLASDPRLADTVSSCSINLSGLSLGDEELIEAVSDWLEGDHRIPASVLCFEVTETAAVQNLVHARAFLNRLRALGCRFALDDFGTGLSSFGYLKQLPVDIVKIDGTFVRDMVRDPIDQAMVSAINDVAHQVGLKTVAEFVEDEETLKLLRKIGVDFAQGYGIGLPMPLDDLISSRTRDKGHAASMRQR